MNKLLFSPKSLFLSSSALALCLLASCAKDELVTYDTRHYPSVGIKPQDKSIRAELQEILQKKKYNVQSGKSGSSSIDVYITDVEPYYTNNSDGTSTKNFKVGVYSQLLDNKKNRVLWGDYGKADSGSVISIRAWGQRGNDRLYSTLRVAVADSLESLPSLGRVPGDRDAEGNALNVPYIPQAKITKRNSGTGAKRTKESVSSGQNVQVRDTVDNILSQMQ